jgi:hypothetical protein
MKWSASLCFAAYEVEPFMIATVPFDCEWPFNSAVAMLAVILWLVDSELCRRRRPVKVLSSLYSLVLVSSTTRIPAPELR